LVEQLTLNQLVAGSNPAGLTTIISGSYGEDGGEKIMKLMEEAETLGSQSIQNANQFK
jgi:hypothetical protein